MTEFSTRYNIMAWRELLMENKIHALHILFEVVSLLKAFTARSVIYDSSFS